jgi:hypothetical protein
MVSATEIVMLNAIEGSSFVFRIGCLPPTVFSSLLVAFVGYSKLREKSFAGSENFGKTEICYEIGSEIPSKERPFLSWGEFDAPSFGFIYSPRQTAKKRVSKRETRF